MTDFKKIQKDMENSKQKIITPDDNLAQIRKKLGRKYIEEDVSDTDDDFDENSTFRDRHNKFIEKNVKISNKNIIKKNSKVQKNKQNKKDEESVTNKDNSELDKEESENEDESEDEDEDDDISIDKYEFKAEFEKLIKDYVKNDNEIKEHRLRIKELNSKKDACQIEIMKHLERLGENHVRINGGTLRINQYESKGGLKEDLIKDAILEKVKNPKITEEILEVINDKRENNKKLQKSLKRTYERNKK